MSRLVSALIALAAVLGAMPHERAAAAGTPVVRYAFEEAGGSLYVHGQGIHDSAGVSQTGRVALAPTSSTMLRRVTNPVSRLGRGMHFGEAGCSGTSPVRCRSLARVAVPASSGSFSPGSRNFSYSAVIRLTAAPRSGAAGGMNVMQLGLSATPDMWKLQLDGGVPSCVVRNDGGRASVVRRPAPLTVGVSYNVRCTRTNGRLILTIARLDAAGAPTAEPARTAPTSATGSLVSFGSRPTMQIGAKGSTSNPDQLSNVLLDEISLTIG